MTQSPVNLSYVITTYNKFSYLQGALATLIKHKQLDEEIIVIEGGGTDGSREYITELFNKGTVDQFLSEPDRGEAHGYNKGFLMARGKLIKVISDDDCFYYDEIQRCKRFMLDHSEIDILGTDGLFGSINEDESSFSRSNYRTDFEAWKSASKPFNFSGLGLMLRRSSLPLFGLLDTSFVWVDAEFSLRLTSGKANIAWYTGVTWKRIQNPSSNTLMQKGRLRLDAARLKHLYPNSNLKESWQKRWRRRMHRVLSTLFGSMWRFIRSTSNSPEESPASVQAIAEEFLYRAK